MVLTVRPFEESDRAVALEFLHDNRSIDSEGHYVRVAEENSQIVGVAMGIVPSAGEEAWLGPVTLGPTAHRDCFLGLIAALVEKAIDLGFTVGVSETESTQVVAYLRATFTLEGRPSAWEPVTRKPVEWRYKVNLPDFLEQLKAVM